MPCDRHTIKTAGAFTTFLSATNSLYREKYGLSLRRKQYFS